MQEEGLYSTIFKTTYALNESGNLKSILSLLSELKNHKALMLLILFFGAVSSALKATTAGFGKVMGDLIFEQSPQSGVTSQAAGDVKSFIVFVGESLEVSPLIAATLLLALSFVLANVFRYFFMYKVRSLAETKAVEAREKLMKHYLYLDARFKSNVNEGSGSLISRILNDVLLFQTGVAKLSDLLREPFLVLFASIWLFILNWKVGVFLFLGLPPILLIVKNLAKSLRKHSRRNQETMESLTMTLKEGLDGARLIHSFNLEVKILDKFKEHTKRYLKTVKKIISREELSGPITESISSLIFCGSFLLIAYLVKNEGLSFGDFFGISIAVGFLTDSAKKTQSAYIRTQQAAVAKSRIDQIIGDFKNQKYNEGRQNFPLGPVFIEVENLNLSIGDKKILKNLNFSVSPQKTVALVGPSGSGKSTFLNALDLYITPSSGKILINDVDTKLIDGRDLRNNISLVSQEPFLFNMSLFENFKLIKEDLTEEGAREALKLANADFVFSLPDGLHTQVGERGSRFSGGERQRLSIARALIKDSPILLLDEATSALDTQSEIEVQKGLDSLKKGRTCFVVAHRLSTIKDADLILVFKDGEVIESGTHSELASGGGLYSELYSES